MTSARIIIRLEAGFEANTLRLAEDPTHGSITQLSAATDWALSQAEGVCWLPKLVNDLSTEKFFCL